MVGGASTLPPPDPFSTAMNPLSPDYKFTKNIFEKYKPMGLLLGYLSILRIHTITDKNPWNIYCVLYYKNVKG